jgi:hypothetical protein
MQKLKFHASETPEILFILGSTSDTRGRRCLVRLDGTENVVYPDDLADETLHLIGLNDRELAIIQRFFEG